MDESLSKLESKPAYLVIDAADDAKWHGSSEEFFVRPLSAMEPSKEDEQFVVVRPYAGERLPKTEAELQHFVAVLISGSARSANDDIEWIHEIADLIRLVARQSKTRLYATCFGHQLVAHALGGAVAKREVFLLGSERIMPSHDLWVSNVSSQPRLVLQAHGDEVASAPPNSEVLASSDTAAIESFIIRSPTDPGTVVIWTLQGHPELTVAALEEKVLPAVRHKLADQGKTAERDLEEFSDRDAVAIMQAVKKFISEGW